MDNRTPSRRAPAAHNHADRASWVDSRVLFKRLGELSLACGAKNTNELAIVLIGGCLVDQVNTIGRIIGVLKHFRFKRQQVARILERHAGPDPLRSHWYRDANATYHLHG